VLEISGVTKTFGHTYALQGVDLDIEPGEVHALVGHNGSGKSTLVKLMAGYHTADGYRDAHVDGIRIELGDPMVARSSGLRFVHQELGLVEQLDAVENVLLGQRYPLRSRVRIDWPTSRRLVSAVFERLEYDVPLDRPVAELSLQQRTAVVIARALYGDEETAKVLVFDEPTAAMTSAAVEKLFRVINRLKNDGIGILYISHHLDEIFSIGDRVSVLRNGRMVATVPAASVTRDELVELMVGAIEPANGARKTRRAGEEKDTAILEVDELVATGVNGVSLSAAPGEIVGVAGLAGSGRDQLAGAVFGASARSGTVKVDGVEIVSGSPTASIAAGLGLLTADRSTTASFPEWSLGRNITLPQLTRSFRGLFLDRRSESRDAGGWLTRLGVEPSDPSGALNTLSGGNQQRVLLARWLRATRRVVILDEPTQGVDVGAIRRIYTAIEEFAGSGMAFVVCSSDAEELAVLCDRVLVMAGGKIVRELCDQDVNRESIDRACLEISTEHRETDK
jgi:ribose transport system ATP-binding protein